MTGRTAVIDATQVQSLVLRPRPASRLDIAFLTCPDRAALQTVLTAGLADLDVAETTDATRGALNIALTAAGVRLAGVDDRTYRALPAPFREGMRAAATRLGDVDESDPTHWEPPFEPGGRPVHVVVLAVGPAGSAPPPTAWWGGLAPFAEGALAVWTGRRRPGPGGVGAYEPFGFRDDVSVPEIDGSGRPVRPGDGVWDPRSRAWRAVRPGEALMGHVDEAGAVAGHPDAALVERDGSYLVLRRLRQDRALFDAETGRWAGQVGLEPDVVRERIVGRHRDGRALGQPQGADPENGFLYRSGQRRERAAPSSHIRRSNPRDDMDHAERLVPRHQVFRRGIPYGEPDGDGDEGLLFLAVMADIRRQFEFVQSHWLQDGNRFGLGREQDPLTGQRPPSAPTASIPDDDDRRLVCSDLRPFVATRGGEYLLLPGRTALARLARGGPW